MVRIGKRLWIVELFFQNYLSWLARSFSWPRGGKKCWSIELFSIVRNSWYVSIVYIYICINHLNSFKNPNWWRLYGIILLPTMLGLIIIHEQKGGGACGATALFHVFQRSFQRFKAQFPVKRRTLFMSLARSMLKNGSKTLEARLKINFVSFSL